MLFDFLLNEKAFNGPTKEFSYRFNRPGRLILEVKDPYYFMRPESPDEYDHYLAHDAYDYQLLLPPYQRSRQYEVMREDLFRYFELRVTIEKRMVNCFVIVRTTEKDKLKSKTVLHEDTFFQYSLADTNSMKKRYIHNTSYAVFSERMGEFIENKLKKPYFDDPVYKGNIDIELSDKVVDEMNIDLLNSELGKYGLKVVYKKRPVEVLVIKDKLTK